MGYKEEQEAMFQDLEARRQEVETALVARLIRAAKDRGYSIDDMLAILEQPGMTNSTFAKTILRAKKRK